MAQFETIGPLPDQNARDEEERQRRIREKRKAAITIVEVALRRHRIKDLNKVSAKRRAVVLNEIKLALDELEVPDPEEEGREHHN